MDGLAESRPGHASPSPFQLRHLPRLLQSAKRTNHAAALQRILLVMVIVCLFFVSVAITTGFRGGHLLRSLTTRNCARKAPGAEESGEAAQRDTSKIEASENRDGRGQIYAR